MCEQCIFRTMELVFIHMRCKHISVLFQARNSRVKPFVSMAVFQLSEPFNPLHILLKLFQKETSYSGYNFGNKTKRITWILRIITKRLIL